uniref:LEA family epithelial adhesin n=1 Tax=Limosilactobacillus vaginalis TaxID=1633 RepID=UPI0024BBBFEB
MKRPEFLETKRTPRYSLRKLNVGVASVLLGVTIFGINFTDHSVKAATIENVETSNSSPSSQNSNLQQTSAIVLKPAEQTSATEKVQQSSASNNATANNSTEAATTSQSAPKTQGSADTDIKSSTANNSTEAATTSQSAPKTQGSAGTDIKSLAAKNLLAISGTDRNAAAKLAAMNLVAIPSTNRNAAGTVAPFFYNLTSVGTGIRTAKENQDLANKTNLTSSDNYSSNIYKGKDGKYYKIVTIHGNDYVYHAADIQANSTFGQWATTAADTTTNIHISKEDLGNGKTRWTVTFFPNNGLKNAGRNLSGLRSAKFGIALTSDYQIVGNVDMKVNNDANQSFSAHTFEPGSNSATTVQYPPYEVDFSFNPKTDVDRDTGLINSETMPAYNNKYLQGPYYFTTATDTGRRNLWQTYFKDGVEDTNAYGESTYLGGDHDFHLNNFIIKNKTGDVDGAKQGDPIIYDTRNKFNSNGVFNSVNFNQAMEFKSQGDTNNSQFSSYVISFTTQHTDSHEVRLTTGPKNQQFSGIAANIYSIYSWQDDMFSRLYGEQRALDADGNPLTSEKLIAEKIIPNLDEAKAANQAIDQAAQTKDAAIDKSKLTDDEKADWKKQVSDAANEAKGNIDAATKDADVESAKNTGVEKINNINVPDTSANKDAAKKAIDQAAQTKDAAIDKSKLTDDEKAD